MERWLRDRRSANRTTYATVEATPTYPAVTMIDGVPIEGRRVDLVRCSAVELSWRGQLVFCTGLPDIIDGLALRSATPDDG
jgi:hypothetical protein